MFRKTFGHTKSLLPPRTNRCNSPRKPWAHILITGPVFSQAWLGLDFITTWRSKHLWVPERCSTLTHVCLLWFPGKTELSCLTGATGCTLGASQRTVLVVHMVPVATYQLSRAEGSYTHSGVCWETCNTHASTGPGMVTALCCEFAALSNCFVWLLTLLLQGSNTECGDLRSRSERLSPPIRKSSPATYCMSSCCLQQPSTPMIHPNRMMETAMPMKPAVILRRSEERKRRKARQKTWRWQHLERTARGESRQMRIYWF